MLINNCLGGLCVASNSSSRITNSSSPGWIAWGFVHVKSKLLICSVFERPSEESRRQKNHCTDIQRRVKQTNTTMWGITNKKVWIYGGFYVAIIGTCIFLFLCAGWSFVPPSLVNYHQRSNMKGAISLLLIVHSSVHSVPPTFSKPYYDCRMKLINNTEWHDALNYKSFSYCLFICTAISICPWIQAEEGAFNSQLGTWFPWVLLRDSI